MDDIKFTSVGKQYDDEYDTTRHDIAVWRQTEGKLSSVFTRNRTEKGTAIFQEPTLFSVDKMNPAKIYAAYLKAKESERVNWYIGLPVDRDRERAIREETQTFIREHPKDAAECPELMHKLVNAAKIIAIFERYATKRPDSECRDVHRMISWIRRCDEPNAALSYDAAKGLWMVHATETIKELGEILLPLTSSGQSGS